MNRQGIYKAGKFLMYVLLILWGVMIMVPIYWMITTSIKPDSTLITIPPELFPKHITLQHYITMFSVDLVPRWLFNSCFVTGAIILLAIFFDSMAGYAYSIVKPWGYKVFFNRTWMPDGP